MLKRLHKEFKLKTFQILNPFYIFITSGGGVVKSHLAKTNHISLNEVMMYKGVDPEKPTTLLLSSTGVAAVHINGAAIHLELQINVGRKTFSLNDWQQAVLKN